MNTETTRYYVASASTGIWSHAVTLADARRDVATARQVAGLRCYIVDNLKHEILWPDVD